MGFVLPGYFVVLHDKHNSLRVVGSGEGGALGHTTQGAEAAEKGEREDTYHNFFVLYIQLLFRCESLIVHPSSLYSSYSQVLLVSAQAQFDSSLPRAIVHTGPDHPVRCRGAGLWGRALSASLAWCSCGRRTGTGRCARLR